MEEPEFSPCCQLSLGELEDCQPRLDSGESSRTAGKNDLISRQTGAVGTRSVTLRLRIAGTKPDPTLHRGLRMPNHMSSNC